MVTTWELLLITYKHMLLQKPREDKELAIILHATMCLRGACAHLTVRVCVVQRRHHVFHVLIIVLLVPVGLNACHIT